MKFHILGALEAEVDGERLPLGGPSEQKVLAILLLDAGHVVPVSRLVDALWDDPPATAVKQARNAVGRLRRQLASGGEPGPVVTGTGGYWIRVDGDALDARVFQTMVAKAESAASGGDVTGAAALLGTALGMWHGPALAGLPGRVIEAAADAWNERRCAAAEIYYEHRLALGQHRQVIGELWAAVSAHPLRERAVGQLMLALFRCGRQADALQVYARARELLSAELGIDPCPELRLLHQQILTGDVPEFFIPNGRSVHARRAPASVIGRRPGSAAPRVPAGCRCHRGTARA